MAGTPGGYGLIISAEIRPTGSATCSVSAKNASRGDIACSRSSSSRRGTRGPVRGRRIRGQVLDGPREAVDRRVVVGVGERAHDAARIAQLDDEPAFGA